MRRSRETPDACRYCGGIYVHAEDCPRADDDQEDDDQEEREEREACPDCRGACDPWTEDGKPCGLEPEDERGEDDEEPEERRPRKRHTHGLRDAVERGRAIHGK